MPSLFGLEWHLGHRASADGIEVEKDLAKRHAQDANSSAFWLQAVFFRPIERIAPSRSCESIAVRRRLFLSSMDQDFWIANRRSLAFSDFATIEMTDVISISCFLNVVDSIKQPTTLAHFLATAIAGPNRTNLWGIFRVPP